MLVERGPRVSMRRTPVFNLLPIPYPTIVRTRAYRGKCSSGTVRAIHADEPTLCCQGNRCHYAKQGATRSIQLMYRHIRFYNPMIAKRNRWLRVEKRSSHDRQAIKRRHHMSSTAFLPSLRHSGFLQEHDADWLRQTLSH